MIDYKSMGQTIRTERKRRNMTQDQLADAIGISASYMGHIERGTRVMSIDTLEHICRILSLSADGLLGLNDTLFRRVSRLDLTNQEMQIAVNALTAVIESIKA